MWCICSRGKCTLYETVLICVLYPNIAFKLEFREVVGRCHAFISFFLSTNFRKRKFFYDKDPNIKTEIPKLCVLVNTIFFR